MILGMILGGMMAIDMGGPFNKAAYVFGTAAIASGNYDIMASVMIGGMVPPCAIALATLLFKNKFTKEERESGPTNFIMGLAFITEGAIPFAAADPLHVLPSCIIGSGLAGALSMVFGCTLMAPHGGIFVVPVMGNAVMYLVALVDVYKRQGKVYFTADEAKAAHETGERVVLVRLETSPEDIEGMHAAEGILTVRGGMTSHAAVVARGMGTACVSGCGDIKMNEEEKYFELGGHKIVEGDYISLDGSTGKIYLGDIKTVEASVSGDFGRIMGCLLYTS